MNTAIVKGLLSGLAVALFVRFGLEPLGWFFYEASHFTGIGWLYWGYSGFRGAGYLLSLWDYGDLTCVVAGLLVALMVAWRQTRGERS